MLIKLHAEDDYVERLKAITGQRTGSKAVAEAYLSYLDQVDMIARLERENGALREQVRVYQQTIARARDAAIEFVELASQGDLFQPKETTPARLRHLNYVEVKNG